MNKNKSINLWRIIHLAMIFSLILIYLIQWGRMISTPALRTGTDFMAFYAVGRISQDHGFSFAYNIAAQHEIEQTVVGFDLEQSQVLLYNHVPYLIPLLKLIVNVNYTGSFMRWAILMFGFYLIGSIIFLNTISQHENFYLTLSICMLTFFPFFYSLLLGQDTALLFLGISLWCKGILKKQDWFAASGLALTVIRPHMCLILCIPVFFKHRKVWWRFFILAGLLALASLLILGREGTLGFINILRISANGVWYGMNESAMVNLIGLMLRTLPWLDADIIRSVGWVGYLTGIILLSFLWVKTPVLDGPLLSKSIIITLLFVPHLHFHDLTLLIIPLIFAVTLPISKISSIRLSLLPQAISLLFLLEPFRYILPYVLYVILFWWFTKNNSESIQIIN